MLRIVGKKNFHYSANKVFYIKATIDVVVAWAELVIISAISIIFGDVSHVPLQTTSSLQLLLIIWSFDAFVSSCSNGVAVVDVVVNVIDVFVVVTASTAVADIVIVVYSSFLSPMMLTFLSSLSFSAISLKQF